MESMSLMEMFRISPVVNGILLFCSILLLTCLFERIIAYLKVGSMNNTLIERVKHMVRQGQIKEAIAACTRDNNFYAHALEVALNAANLPREEMESIFALYRMKLQSLLNRRLSILGTLAFIGPLIGLFGTVLGIIRAFRDLALSGAGGPTVVAKGIAEALYATAGGIGIAMIAAVFYNMFTAFARGKVQAYDQFSQEIAILNYSGKGGHR